MSENGYDNLLFDLQQLRQQQWFFTAIWHFQYEISSITAGYCKLTSSIGSRVCSKTDEMYLVPTGSVQGNGGGVLNIW